MNRLTLKIACLAVLMAGVVSCSTGNDEDTLEIQNGTFVPENVPKGFLQQFEGKYTGVWLMNDVKTESDNVYSLLHERTAQKNGTIDNNNSASLSYVRFYYNKTTSTSSLELYEFPFKAITRQLFPDQEIAYLTIDLPIGSPLDTEETLYFNIIVDAENSNDNSICDFYAIPLETVGYSENAVYNNFHPSLGIAYLRMPFVVTTKDGNYFAMVLNILPDVSTVSMDIASGMISCNLIIRQIEIYDKEMQKSIRNLDQDLKLTFISTEKKSE